LDKITSRGYGTGFYLKMPSRSSHDDAPPTPPTFALAAKVLSSAGRHRAHVEVRNQIRRHDAVEIIQPGGPAIADRITHLMDVEGRQIELAQPGSRVTVTLANDCDRFDLLRCMKTNRKMPS
jgi:NAD-specific glutamate dehydrogenase